MKSIKTSIVSIAMAMSASTFAADYAIDSVEIKQLFSATFDGLVFQKTLSDGF